MRRIVRVADIPRPTSWLNFFHDPSDTGLNFPAFVPTLVAPLEETAFVRDPLTASTPPLMVTLHL
ncbi:hypothetical protein GCM10023080_059420 [Streptomyces pseudoechinosporeus]